MTAVNITVQRFKDKGLNRHYNIYINHLTNPYKANPKKGSLDAAFFYGFTGLKKRYAKNTLAYAAFVAGKEWIAQNPNSDLNKLKKEADEAI